MSLDDYGSPAFPVQFYLDEISDSPFSHVNWHWHRQVEFSCVLEGVVEYCVESQVFELEQGQGIYVNSEAMHRFKPAQSTKQAKVLSLIVDAEGVFPRHATSLFDSYVFAVIADTSLSCIPLRGQDKWQVNILDLLEQAYQEYCAQSFGVELFVQSALCLIWRELAQNRASVENSSRHKKADASQARLKLMISYIQTHYPEDITLQMIASSANISQSECIRCFNDSMATTPINYVIGYRLSQAMIMLQSTDLSISEIGLECGFGTPSYFAKIFKRETGLTPSQFKKSEFSSP